MITREFPPLSGGIGYYVYNLSKGLIKRGHKVTVVTRGSPYRIEKEIVNGIEVIKTIFFPVYPFHMPLHGFFVNSLLKSRQSQFDLVHLHSPLTPSIRTDLPIVTTVHTAMKIDSRYHEIVDIYSIAEKIQSMYFSPIIETTLLRQSDVITAVSPSVVKELNNYDIGHKKIKVMWNGVNEQEFLPIDSEHFEKYVLYTGVLRARKGLFDFIKCAKFVKDVFPEMKFLICGLGPLMSKLEAETRSYGLQNNIVFLGRVERKRLIEVYQNASIHIIPSIYEGLPTVLLEAMSCGLPVVATDIGGNRDVITSGFDGLLVPPMNPQKMAEMVVQLLGNESLRKQLGRNARGTILNKFTWDKISDNYLTLYESMLER
jgi:glycosyltransferase involved in cell wall biosynthesis